MKALKITVSLFLIILGITMSVFAWLFFRYEDETAIIMLASLYVAQFIAIIVMVLGLLNLVLKKEKKDE